MLQIPHFQKCDLRRDPVCQLKNTVSEAEIRLATYRTSSNYSNSKNYGRSTAIGKSENTYGLVFEIITGLTISYFNVRIIRATTV